MSSPAGRWTAAVSLLDVQRLGKLDKIKGGEKGEAFAGAALTDTELFFSGFSVNTGFNV